jgi:hypothetical protein
MPDQVNYGPAAKRTPWNKGKLLGARPPLRPKHVWAIRTRLLLEGRIRDLALFNLAIDSKLRGCDVVAVKVEDVAPNGHTMDRNGKAEKDGPPRQVRAYRSDPPSHRRLPEGRGQETGSVSVRGSAGIGPAHDDTAIGAPSLGVAGQHRLRPKSLWHALAAANKGNADLPPNRQPTRRPTLARPHQDRKHRQIPRYRGA